MRMSELFRKILRVDQMITDSSILQRYNTDYTGNYKGNSELVLYPRSTQQVRDILTICNSNKVPVITFGGGTSLVAGATPESAEIILSTEKMTNFSFDLETEILTSEAGTVLQVAQNHIKQYGYETPYSLGAKGTCTTGGNVATCAGGVNFIKYGSLRNHVAGIEVVLPTGEVLNLMNDMPKDNTGTNLKHLFIGSEGTLGIITKTKIVCHKSYEFKKMLFLKIPNYESVLAITRKSKHVFGRNLSALEYLDGKTYQVAAKHSAFGDPFNDPDLEVSKNIHHYLIIEVEGGDETYLMNLIEVYSNAISDIPSEILFYETETQKAALWNFRESIVMFLIPEGKMLKYDISIQPKLFKTIGDLINEAFGSVIKYTCNYGHIGDGNVHVQVILEKNQPLEPKLKHQIDDLVYRKTIEWGGSISAEHGIGQIKRPYLKLMKSEATINCMVNLKNVFDPNNILNPNKVL